MVPEKDECFEVELFDPSGGAALGTITKMAVTITNDEGIRCTWRTTATLDTMPVLLESYSNPAAV